MSDKARIDAALAAASETSKSPAKTLHRIMGALGSDFGDVEATEHWMMQHYAEPENNPFVQAQLEARIVLDTWAIERLNYYAKRSLRGKMDEANTLVEISNQLQNVGLGDTAYCGLVAKLFVQVFKVGIHVLDAEHFNKQLVEQVLTMAEMKGEHDGSSS